MANRFNIYSTGHLHSAAVCNALAAGTKLPVVAPAPLQPGGMATYGFLRGLLPTLRQAQAEARPWVYGDRGYICATWGDDHSGYFRLTRDAYQHDGCGYSDLARWHVLGKTIAPWRPSGQHVLICPPGDVFTTAIGGFTSGDWLEQTLATLRKHTKRELRVRKKDSRTKRPLAADLVGCHALVTYMSNVAVEALLAGVPVFCTGQCAASSMGQRDLAEIEFPRFPEDRERWAGVLADNQWTLAELRAGAANHLFEECVA